MIAYHLQPPPAQREGGLDAAIQGLCAALEGAGVEVQRSLPATLVPGSIVHMHGLWQPSYIRAVRRCRRERIPYLVSPHGMLEPWAWQHKQWKKWLYFHAVEKRLLRSAAALLATAEEEAGRLRTLFPQQRVEALRLGLTGDAQPDYRRARIETGWQADERVLLFLSRLHPKKGLELLLEALTQVSYPGPLRLVIVGDGAPDYVASLKAFAKARSDRLPRIQWMGPVWGEERWTFFQGADLFCLPTYSENFGLAVLEALQVGTPVLTTRATPWGALLAAPRGFICDPEVGSVAAALGDALRTDSGENARAELAAWTHACFAWKNLAASYVALYRSLPMP